jgi:hypothetical protein
MLTVCYIGHIAFAELWFAVYMNSCPRTYAEMSSLQRPV